MRIWADGINHERAAGILVPLFSIPSTESWGIGEFGDIPRFAQWLRRAGIDVLQLLPLHETAGDECSPYSPISAMALDPQFITLRAVPDFEAIGGERSLDAEARAALTEARHAPRVDYRRVRSAKRHALRRAFDRFLIDEWKIRSRRAEAFKLYVDQQSWWLDSYALFRALRAAGEEQSWSSWPEPLQRAEHDALERSRADLANEILFYQYLQWIAEEQWQAARRAAAPLALFGDFPFLVTIDSADVWARQDEFLLDATVGAPPDAFTREGQDWGLPPCNWEVMAARDDEWIRHRVRRMSALFDGYRVDHLVGFYRTYIRPRHGRPYFAPGSERKQLDQGERLMRIFLESGDCVTVEDLGNVPIFVRASLARLGLPGYRVLRWERRWHEPEQPFIDPAEYPATSVATSGTHDTDTMAAWWASTTEEERAGIAELPTLRTIRNGDTTVSSRVFDNHTRDVLLEALYAAGSDLLILPVQDVFGWRDRINEPGKVDDENWTFKLPWPVDRLEQASEAGERADQLRLWAGKHGRVDGRSTERRLTDAAVAEPL